MSILINRRFFARAIAQILTPTAAIKGRKLLARTGKRTLVIGDISWLNQLLQAYVSKLFALSYGIATIEVHSADPQNHLLHNFGQRVVRGTLFPTADAANSRKQPKVR